VVPILLLVTAAWVGTLAYLNVRARREEIGLLRAVGVRSGRIAGLFLGKAALFGLLGAALGFALGTAVALGYGPGLFELTAKKLRPSWPLLPWCLAVAPLMAVLASALPALVAVSMDPAEALRQE
jgi:ABC-type antimicrobial peptide transport system permease subunit